ncbi:MAG: hypothetical protein P4L79_01645 [Legionella sp.]|uniref:hypothetical protein n=1 Tax=Legionella sp. TaxID=459 RepID=UPI0028435740|nr:hypothetical protein [Legionella sp.]
MSFIELSIFLLFLATISVPLAARAPVPFEIFLVAASAIISLIPGLPRIQISPDKLGKIHNEVFHLLSDELDLEELRAKTLRL